MTPLASSRLRPPRALLLDLDGTVVDSRRDIADACNAALKERGLADVPFESILGMIGDGARALVARAVSASAREPVTDGEVEAVLASFRAHYLARPCVHTVFLPGARGILDDAAVASLPCALVTNKPREVTLALLDALGIAGAFRVLWAGDGPLKPAPDGLLAVLAALGVDAADSWMIGDGPQDVGAGRAAGCVTIGVPGIAARELLVASAPDVLCDSLNEVRELLRTLVARPTGVTAGRA